MTDLRVAIVGNGGIYKLAHGPAWCQIPRARVVATCDIVKERAEQACQEMGAEASFARIEDLLEMDGIDLVDICTPSDTHAKLAIQALRAGKHVICEKPMALTPKAATRMIEAAEDAKRHLYIGHTRRFDRRWVQMKEQIMGGRIGEPVAVRRTERCWGAFPKEDWHWDLARSGGVLMDLGIHVADLFSWFLDAEPTEVYAKALMVREEAQEQNCFDFGIIQVGFPRGKRGIMEVSWAHPKEYAPLYSTTEVIGTRGKLTLTDKDAAPMTVVKREIGIPRYSPLLSSFPETFVDELSHFLDCILQNTPPRITLAQASTAVKVIATAFESIASGGQFRYQESFKMLNLAIIGYDHAHLPRYVPTIAEHLRTRLVAVVAPGANRDLAKQHAARFGARYLEDLEPLWKGEKIDAVYIGTPPNQHLSVIQELLPRGIHILCDKPLATTLDDADSILGLVKQHGGKFMVPFNPRYQLPVMRLKEMIEAGELGRLHHIHATKYGKLPRGIPGLDTSWFFDRSRAGFGGFGDIGIHAIDALRWLSRSEARQVYARIDRMIHRDIAVDDVGTAIIEFQNGVLASLQSGWVNPTGNSTWLSVSFEVLGTAGSVLIEKPYHDLELADESRMEQLPWWRADIPMLVNEFISAVEEGRQPAITGADARAALEITIAAYRSAETGQPISLPL